MLYDFQFLSFVDDKDFKEVMLELETCPTEQQ